MVAMGTNSALDFGDFWVDEFVDSCELVVVSASVGHNDCFCDVGMLVSPVAVVVIESCIALYSRGEVARQLGDDQRLSGDNEPIHFLDGGVGILDIGVLDYGVPHVVASVSIVLNFDRDDFSKGRELSSDVFFGQRG